MLARVTQKFENICKISFLHVSNKIPQIGQEEKRYDLRCVGNQLG